VASKRTHVCVCPFAYVRVSAHTCDVCACANADVRMCTHTHACVYLTTCERVVALGSEGVGLASGSNGVLRKPCCCLDTGCSQKVRRLFPTPEALATDTEWLSLVLVWAKTTRLCNMHIERSLAKLRRAIGKPDAGAAPDASLTCASGAVGEFLSLHLHCNGKDPAVDTRADCMCRAFSITCAHC
jgi:hypothetical protein